MAVSDTARRAAGTAMPLDTVLQSLVRQMKTCGPDWRMPWHGRHALPVNVSSGRAYSGINRLILWTAAAERQFASRYWGTFNQWQGRRQPVRFGERGTLVVRPSAEATARAGEPRYRVYHVFNGDQVCNRDDAHPDLFPDGVAYVGSVEALLERTGAQVRHGGDRAYYSVREDRIQLPPRHLFFATATTTVTQAYYATVLHELAHWTGHPARLARFPEAQRTRRSRAYEELVAELGAAFLCAEFDLADEPRVDHAQYLRSWLRALDEDLSFVTSAAAVAQKCTEYLLQLDRKEPEADDSLPPWFAVQPWQPDLWQTRM